MWLRAYALGFGVAALGFNACSGFGVPGLRVKGSRVFGFGSLGGLGIWGLRLRVEAFGLKGLRFSSLGL